MPIYLSLILVMIVSFTIVPVVGWLLRRHRAKQDANWLSQRTAWAEELLATYQTNPEARKVLVEYWRYSKFNGLDEELTGRVKSVYQQLLLEESRRQHLPGLNDNFERFTSEHHPIKKADLLLQISTVLDQCQTGVLDEFEAKTGLNKAIITEMVGSLINQRIKELTAILAEQSNHEAFRELNLLRYDCMDEYRTYGRKFAPYASSSSWVLTNWNELVAQYVANPHLYDFTGMRDMPVGEARRLAAEALRDQNLTDAKIVLAWCNFNAKIRVEVGDVLTADLAKFVATEAKHRSENHG